MRRFSEDPEASLKNISKVNTADIDRPYERCLLMGASSLSDAQLLAVILRTGTYGQSAVEVAGQILAKARGGLPGLVRLSVRDLMQVPGIGQVKAVELQCVCELSKRIAQARAAAFLSFSDPETIAEYYMEQLRHEEQELLLAVMLDSKYRFLGDETVSRGTADTALISSRDLFIRAFAHRASHMILLHNHPSGDPSPSQADAETTETIRQAGELLGIPLEDHIIIGDRRYFSFRQEGLLEA